MVTTVIGIICGLSILWAIELRFNEIFKKTAELEMTLFKIKTALDEINIKMK